MLPSVVASELEQVAADAIRTAFHPTTPGFSGLIDRFLAEREQLLKGPYVSVALPFQQGTGRNWFPQIPLPFPPYRHQEKAFERLSPGSPRNTLVATGTGSGKTECFLLPLLEHCRQQQAQGQRGIKAILIYPMNALATDQARRIADLIHTTPALAGLRAGLYIGASDDTPAAAMTATSVITDKEALHKAPPDILLTNYKQLDYLLIQPHVQSLWEHNGRLGDGTSTLRYLVVDEFHTFDGAQGTDLACLIRRLRDRLQCPGDELVCVGTSATLGGPESREAMRSYAGQIFASSFEPASLIEEERLSPEEFFRDHTAFGDEGLRLLPLPGPEALDQLDPEHAASAESYLAAQAALWLADSLPPAPEGNVQDDTWRLALGSQLGTLPAVHNLVRQAERTCSIEELLERFSRQLGLGDQYPRRYRVLLLESLLALIAHARRTTTKLDGSPVVVPWLNLRVQLWLRELKRMVASVEATPQLRHSDDLAGSESSIHLPVVHCRDCGATAWTSTALNSTSNTLDRANNLRNFYKAFFSGAPELRYLFPQGNADAEGCSHQLCSSCLSFHPAKELADATPTGAVPVCPNCQSRELVPVDIPDCSTVDDNNHPRVSRDCPYCNAQQGLLLIGSSAANLTSTWSASLFASAFNGDKKLLAFSDSVQDAAHRAGYIAARAYRTSFRTALTTTLQQAGASLPLDQLQERLISDWQQRFPNPVDFAATFIPHDLEWLREWDALQQQLTPSLEADGTLMRFVCDRLRWEVAAEFGYRSRLGSSVEQAGALAAAVDPAVVNKLLPSLLTRLQNEIEPLRGLRLGQLQPSERSLSEVVINTRAESELELRFIEKLRDGKGAPPGVTVTLRDDFIKGNKGYLLTFTSGPGPNGSPSVVSWKVEQQVPIGEAEGVGVFSRADFLLTPTAGGKPIAIYTDGWEYHRGRLATDAEQRMALQRSGRYLFWALSWDDVVEAPPTAQAPLDPNGLAVGMIPAFANRPETFIERWWPQPLLDSLLSAPPLMPRQAQLASSLQLLMAYLANPSEALWQGMAQQFCLAQASPLAMESPELSAAADALQLDPHVQEWQADGASRRVGQHLTPATGLQILNLVDMGLHERRHPAASFRAIHFEPDPNASQQQQQASWREWLRQGNLFQFLPHLLISTPGWGGSEQTVAVDPPQVWVTADPAKVAPGGSTAPESATAERQQAWQDLGRFAPAEVQPLLEALEATWQDTDHPLPEQAFELEGPRGDVLAQAELAWPEQRLAVVSDPVDGEAFTAAGWRCWALEDPPGSTAAALAEALTSC